MVKITKWFMLVAFTVIVVYDVLVATNAAKGDTISEIQGGWAWTYQTLPLAWGVVVGHLFWPVRTLKWKWPKIYGMWVLGVVIGVLDLWYIDRMFPFWPLLAGCIIGHVLWPQSSTLQDELT